MAVKVRIEPLGPAIEALIDRTLSPKAQTMAFRKFAEKEIQKADNINRTALGRIPEKVIYVDGRISDTLEGLKVPGSVVVEYEIVSDLVEQIMIYLRRTAPVLTGRFRDTIWIYADGVRVTDPAQTVGASEIIIAPTVAYARKIERGQGKFPGKLFENAAKYAQKKFRGGGVSVKFTFADIIGGGTHLGRWAQKRPGRNRHQQARDRRNPALIIRFR
jgi:hypothetical protein